MKRFRIGDVEIYGGIKRVAFVNGINSLITNGPETGRHILMWDFDDVEPLEVIQALTWQVIAEDLAPIYIYDTNKEYPEGDSLPFGRKNLHAFCFQSFEWREAFRIVWETGENLKKSQGIKAFGVGIAYPCDTFLKMAFAREYFTLRFGVKNNRRSDLFTRIHGIESNENIEKNDLDNFVRYLTVKN